MNVAVYTDASIKANRGAWAAVVIREGSEPVEFFGPLRGTFKSSAATELAAIGNALHAARRGGLIHHGDRVEVRCDNMAAVLRIRGGVKDTRRTDPRLIEIERYVRQFRHVASVDLVALHVKGHQRLDSGDPHAFHNQRCDMLCSAVRDGRTPPPAAHLARMVAVARERRAKAQEAVGA